MCAPTYISFRDRAGHVELRMLLGVRFRAGVAGPRQGPVRFTRGMGLTIPQAILNAIIAHAQAEHPYVACGLVAGPVDLDRPERFIPVRNAERSTTFFMFDPIVQLRVQRDMDERGEEPIVIYFSHTATDALPSRSEVSFAAEPIAHYVIVSTRDPQAPEVRSFRIADGQVAEEPIHVIPT